jgi:hypothetical protein
MDFTTSLIKDSRLMVKDTINYGVVKGGETITHQRNNVVAASTTSLVFNVQVPSLQTVIDRRVMLGADITLKISGTTANNTTYLVNYGTTDALAPFPFHQMMATMTSTLNSSSVSVNVPDILAPFLKLHDKRQLNKYNSSTTTLTDIFSRYSDATTLNSNPLGSAANFDYDDAFRPNGAWELLDWGPTSNMGKIPQPIGTPTASQDFYVKFHVDEPLLFLSPFTYTTESNTQGMYGIQNMNFQFQLQGATRAWRSTGPANKTVSLVAVDGAYLDFIFINGHPSDLLPSKNIVPYLEYPRYISGGQNLAAQAAVPPVIGAITPEAVWTSQALTLNVVPDKLVIYARSRSTASSCLNADKFLGIKNVNISFNNSSGILASAEQRALWSMSHENGSNQSWEEFRGFISKAPVTGAGVVSTLPTVGSIVVLTMGKDIQLVQDYISAGSIGNYSLQVKCNVYNPEGTAVPDGELVIVAINSGIVVLEQGVSSIFTGILTKEDVLKASDPSSADYNAIGWNENVRMTGSGLLDQVKTLGKSALKLAQPLFEGSKAGEAFKKMSGGKKMANRLM